MTERSFAAFCKISYLTNVCVCPNYKNAKNKRLSIMRSAACFSAPYRYAAVVVISQLCSEEWKRPTPVRKELMDPGKS